ncbi:hypothetical protein E2C01_008425 [Portunus trituberculatus]|uniref:Uncharacterized protein n=1 Tax=Portunus trituberculatus TaxID=210409 RepID=A0A5B7D2T9_PORTR|nr:hypothetical protein [Portunus trituberculatus]
MNTAIFAWPQHHHTVAVITIITIITAPPLPHWTLTENAWYGLFWLGLVCKDVQLTNTRILYGWSLSFMAEKKTTTEVFSEAERTRVKMAEWREEEWQESCFQSKA